MVPIARVESRFANILQAENLSRQPLEPDREATVRRHPELEHSTKNAAQRVFRGGLIESRPSHSINLWRQLLIGAMFEQVGPPRIGRVRAQLRFSGLPEKSSRSEMSSRPDRPPLG